MLTFEARQVLRAEIDRAVRARCNLPGHDGKPVPTGLEPSILVALANGPMKTGDLVAVSGGSQRRSLQALEYLRVEGRIKRQGLGSAIRWSVP